MENSNEQREDKSRWNPNVSDELNRELQWCESYYLNNSENIPNGKYVTVIYPRQEILQFDTFQEAINATKGTKGRGKFVVEHPWDPMVRLLA